MMNVDVTVIGGGIVGCAVAARSVAMGFRTVLLERDPRLGGGITSRNSEVAHGGMYYPTGSLKARLCVEGRRRLRAFCETVGVPYRECGKLIVAVDQEELPELERLKTLGEANGVEDLALLDAAEVCSLEPEISAIAALWSPRTALVDAEGCTRALGRLIGTGESHVLTSAEVEGLEQTTDGWTVFVCRTGGPAEADWHHRSRWVVNAAGLDSDRVAGLAGLDVDALEWRLRWVKGNYFAVSPRHDGRVSRLVYPVPPRDGSSLGVHLCLDMAGRMRLGPDVEPLTPSCRHEDYSVDPQRRDEFFHGARRFLPFLERDDLGPDMCGLRPRRATWWRDGFADFVVSFEEGGREGLINLVGIESPGLTAAMALAEDVGAWIARDYSDGRTRPW